MMSRRSALKGIAAAFAAFAALSAALFGMGRAEAAAANTTMLAYMMSVVGPAVQPIWDGSYADKLSDQDWDGIKKAAADLVAAAPTIATAGFTPTERQRANLPAWKEWYGKFTTAAQQAKVAADAKNQDALAMAGDALVEICEGCHTAFPLPIPQ